MTPFDAVRAPPDHRILVMGGPGFGKTQLGVERAKHLARSGDGAELIVFNRPLEETCRRQLASSRAHVRTFHSWFWSWYRNTYFVDPPQIEPYVFDWQQVFDKVNRHPPSAGSAPHLLIDGNRDVPFEFFALASVIAQGLTILVDQRSALGLSGTPASLIRQVANIEQEVTLTGPGRFTTQIAAVVEHFADGNQLGDVPSRQGQEAQLHHFDGLAALTRWLIELESRNAGKSIGTIVEEPQDRDALFFELRGSGVSSLQRYERGRTHFTMDPTSSGLKVLPYHACGGLEFDIAVLPFLQNLTFQPDSVAFDAVMYELASRAKDELHFSYEGAVRPRSLERLPPFINEIDHAA